MIQSSQLDCFLLRTLRALIGPVPVALEVAGQSEPEPPAESVGTVSISDRRTLCEMIVAPEMGFGDGFSEGRVSVRGDLVVVLEALYSRRSINSPALRMLSRWLRWTQANSYRGARRNIHRHYDLSNDFYKLWLDPELVYTCAYFVDESDSLEAAQRSKMEMVCRKLRLRPGETVVEAGCGWGALSLYMARNYGVRVKAFNISHEQIVLARERAWSEGLASRVEFIEDDYRNISGRFDAFVSVGMLEHVGVANYKTFAGVIHRAIGDTGRGFLHFIGRNYPTPLSVWIRRHIFPGGEPPALSQVMNIFEPHNYSVLDIENLRQHYALTLEHWLSRFDRAYDSVVRLHGDKFARMWRLYLAGSVAGFTVGTMQLFQVVFAGSGCNRMPLTRSHLYQEAQRESGKSWIPAMS